VDDLTSEFVAETRETLAAIGTALVGWETHPDQTARLDEIFRFVHTVKGSCGFLDLPRIGALAHAAESVLGDLRSGERAADTRVVGAMLALIDRIALLTEALESGDAVPPEASDLALIRALDSQPDVGPVEDSNAQIQVTADQTVKPARTVRIAVDLLDEMMNQISDLVLARNELSRGLRAAGNEAAMPAVERLSLRIGDLRDSIARARMQPVDRLFAALPRLARDTAMALGKSVKLVLLGSDVELDREMVEQLRDPLLHIVRNAIDHGIESPDERVRAGKPAEAILRITARQSGNQIAIEIADDGRGIDIDRLRLRAVEAEVVDLRKAEQMTDSAIAQLIFAPGLSTAGKITEISGRGVGMDVARANVERLGGSIALDNRVGSGLTVSLRAPLTLSIVNVLSVTASDQRFAIPLSVIEEIFSAKSVTARIETVGDGRIVTIRDDILPLVSLSDVLGLGADDEVHILVIEPAGGRRFAIAAGHISDHEEVVVRPVAPGLAGSGVFAGQTLPGHGGPLLLIDALGLARHAHVDREREQKAATGGPVEAPGDLVLTFVGIDGLSRAVRTALVERIEDIERAAFTAIGADTLVTIDGGLWPVVLHGELPEDGAITILRLTDGQSNVAYPVRTVIDLARLDRSQNGIGNVILLDGKAVHMIDGHALFSGVSRALNHRPVVAIADREDRWIQAILVPLLRDAGYEVADDPADPQAVAVLSIVGQSLDVQAARDNRYGTAPRASVAINRYDRDAIIAAIARSTASKAAG